MKIEKEILINDIENKPFSYTFLEDRFIAINAHNLSLIYDKSGNLISKIDDIHHPDIFLLPNDFLFVSHFGNKIYDIKGKLTSLKFKATKKVSKKAFHIPMLLILTK